jgi:hypothetical protein
MKQITQIPTTLIRCCALVALTALVWLPLQVSAQTKGEGASKLIQLKPIQTVEALQSVEAGDTIVMSCPKCKDTYATVVEKSFKGVNQDELKKTTIHLCSACDTKIVTKGQGKSARDVVVHTCKACGSEDVSCCVMKKGAGATRGMEKK